MTLKDELPGLVISGVQQSKFVLHTHTHTHTHTHARTCTYAHMLTQSCLSLCNPMDCSLTDSSVHGIFQARIFEWVAISYSSGPSRPRD